MSLWLLRLYGIWVPSASQKERPKNPDDPSIRPLSTAAPFVNCVRGSRVQHDLSLAFLAAPLDARPP